MIRSEEEVRELGAYLASVLHGHEEATNEEQLEDWQVANLQSQIEMIAWFLRHPAGKNIDGVIAAIRNVASKKAKSRSACDHHTKGRRNA